MGELRRAVCLTVGAARAADGYGRWTPGRAEIDIGAAVDSPGNNRRP